MNLSTCNLYELFSNFSLPNDDRHRIYIENYMTMY